jgi:isocitrate/isopropylmalate dehydrogenase
MMLDDLGHEPLGDAVRAAVEATCASRVLTPDVGGSATTEEVGAAILGALAPTRGSAAGDQRPGFDGEATS